MYVCIHVFIYISIPQPTCQTSIQLCQLFLLSPLLLSKYVGLSKLEMSRQHQRLIINIKLIPVLSLF